MGKNIHIEKAEGILERAYNVGTDLRQKVEKSDKGAKWWQTMVALAAAVAAGLSGYNASGKVSPEWLLLISVLIAVAGILGNISNIWKIQEKATDYRDRYDQCRSLRSDIEAKLRIAHAYDSTKTDEIGALLIQFNHDSENRLNFLTDEYARPPALSIKTNGSGIAVPQ